MQYWLIKSDPDEFSWDNLKKLKGRSECWDGVRNYQARNFLKEMKINDLTLFYQSVVQPQTIMGIVRIVKEAYPDYTQFDSSHINYDPQSSKKNPRWFMVNVKFKEDIVPPITGNELKDISELRTMVLFRNTRLSVQPVTQKEWKLILNLRA